MNRLWILCLALVLLAVAFFSGGTAPFGRIALALDMPQLAAALFQDPAWRGVAAYRAGHYEKAVQAFRQAGPGSVFNLGNAWVHTAYYAAALEAYDRVLFKRPSDAEARANFDLVAAFYGGTPIEADAIARWEPRKEGPTAQSGIARGSARASGTGADVTNSGPGVGLPLLQSRAQRGVRKVFDDKFVVAGSRWLATLEDVPGAFLAVRIAHEHKRRAKAGIGQKAAEEPW